jgi:hypothetical protein
MLGNLAAGWKSPDLARRQQVVDLFDQLAQADILIFLTFDHVQELLKHDNDDVVQSRLAFLAEIPLLAWCSHYHREMDLGGILDLGGYELTAIESGCRSVAEIREFVRSQIVSIGPGRYLINRNAEQWLCVRPLLIERLERERQVASITHRPLFDHITPNGLTVGDILKQAVSPVEESKAREQRLAALVMAKLATQADPKLSSVRDTAKAFAALTARDRLKAAAREQHPFEFALKQSWLDLESVSLDLDADYVTEMVMLVEKLNVTRDHMRQNRRHFNLQSDTLPPSLDFWRRLQPKTSALPRAAGSDIADRYLATFALYLDLFHADKRTNEFIRQLRTTQWEGRDMLGVVFAAGTVDQLQRKLAGHCR